MTLCKQLTEDLEMVILAHLQIHDLIRLSVVCKNWRHMILTSDSFRDMHRLFCKSQTRTLVLVPIKNKSEEPSVIMFPCETYSPASEQPLLSTGATRLMGLNYDSDYRFCGSHGGLVCMALVVARENKLYSCSYKVGNSVTNVWKNCISPPHDVSHAMFPQGIMVDHASNSYMLLASCNIGNSMETEVSYIIKPWRRSVRPIDGRDRANVPAPRRTAQICSFVMDDSDLATSQKRKEVSFQDFNVAWFGLGLTGFRFALFTVSSLQKGLWSKHFGASNYYLSERIRSAPCNDFLNFWAVLIAFEMADIRQQNLPQEAPAAFEFRK